MTENSSGLAMDVAVAMMNVVRNARRMNGSVMTSFQWSSVNAGSRKNTPMRVMKLPNTRLATGATVSSSRRNAIALNANHFQDRDR